MDSNHDKQYQKLLCYRYTIAQTMDVPASGTKRVVREIQPGGRLSLSVRTALADRRDTDQRPVSA